MPADILFQHTAARRRLVLACDKMGKPEEGFNTQPPEGGWMDVYQAGMLGYQFQHTAARRRLEPLSKALLHQVSQP